MTPGRRVRTGLAIAFCIASCVPSFDQGGGSSEQYDYYATVHSHCMDAKTSEADRSLCDNRNPVDPDVIAAACDLDPEVDYDGDGVADNDDDEACAGYPDVP